MRRFWLTVSVLFAAALVLVHGAIPASDSFTRADGALGANWNANSTCTLSIVSNAVRLTGVDDFCIASWAADTFNADQCSQITIPTLSNADSASAGVRTSGQFGSTLSMYLLTADGGKGSTLDKIVSNVGSQIRSLAATNFVAGDIIKLCVQGTTLTAFRNGSTLSTDTDSSIATGQPSFTIFDSSQGGDGNVSVDDWIGANNIAAPSGVRRATTMGIGQ